MKYQLNYETYGTGEAIYLAFHGFGQSKRVFRPFPMVLENVKIYAFDLFFHGSEWEISEGIPHNLTPEIWHQILEKFLIEHQIKKFGLIGFSMGGKVALTTVLAFPNQIDDLILIAPDGIQPNFWYETATRFSPSIFQKIINQKVPVFEQVVHGFQKVGLLEKSWVRLYDSQTQNIALRERVFRTWMVYRNFRPDLEEVGNLLVQNKNHIRLFIGKFDKLITLSQMKKLTQYLEDYDLQVLESGHQGMLQATFRALKEDL